MEEKKATTQALIENIGKEKMIVNEAVEIGREDEDAAAKLQARVHVKHDFKVTLLYSGMSYDLFTCA